ncbi:hypothetical protein EZV73_15085 [Acidaminobacter sp. JC074]|uniref:S41 family peptidase n=1 Tax=Acidaminobacter sp. JC074 TaxID=2530199 RepID=UPI001F0E9A9C|nr:S41 family peptidase [Acidaminobacter sp. JC074]MCH4888918.1 hypothetical protein [Acidaminobacter sp. JC074]
MKKIIRFCLTMLFCIVFISCEQVSTQNNHVVDSNPINQYDNDVVINFEDYAGKKFDLHALEKSHQHYIKLDDFIDLVNQINNKVKTLKEVTADNYHNGCFKFTLRHDMNVSAPIIYGITSGGLPFEVNNYESVGEDLEISLDLNKTLLTYILKDNEVYLPLNIINSEIFREYAKFIRIDDKNYLLTYGLGFEEMEILIKESEAPYDDDYDRSYKSLVQYFKATAGINSDLGEVSIDDYPSFLAKLHDLKVILKDSHYIISRIYSFNRDYFSEDDLSKIDSAHSAISLEKNKEIYESISFEEPVRWEALNDETIYVRVDTFMVDNVLFKSRMNHLKVELIEQDYTKIVIDLRDNPGGYDANGSMLLDSLGLSNFDLRIGYLYDNEIFTQATYKLSRIKDSKRDYDLVIILNEYCFSNSVLFANIIKDNVDVKIVGKEPLDKKTEQVSYYQTLDGTIISKSQTSYTLLNKNGVRYNHVQLVDEVMTDDEIKVYLEEVRVSQ